MSKYFKKVATPKTQMRQSKAPSGPDVDVNARAEIENEYKGGLANAVQSLLGIAQGVAKVGEIQDKAETEHLRKNYDVESKEGARGVVGYLETYKHNDAPLSELEGEELVTAIKAGSAQYMKDNKLNEKKYSKILKMDVDEMAAAYAAKKSQRNITEKNEKYYNHFGKEVETLLANNPNTTPQDAVEFIKEFKSNYVGSAIKDDDKVAEGRFLQKVVELGVTKGDMNFLRTLQSKEVREQFSNIEDYDVAVGMVSKEANARANGIRQSNFDLLKQEAFSMVEANAFSPRNGRTSESLVNEFIKEKNKSFGEDYQPSKEDIIKLKEDLLGESESVLEYNKYKQAKLSGDYSYGKRMNIKKKDQDKWNNQLFTESVPALEDMSVDSIETFVTGASEKDIAAFKDALRTQGVPPALAAYGSESNYTTPKQMEKKNLVFQQLNTILEGTKVSIYDIYDPKEVAKIQYIDRLTQEAEQGAISQEEAYAASQSFFNDLKKNIDAYGNYTSRLAEENNKTDEHLEWLKDNSTDADWTWDEFTDSSYRRRELNRYFSIAIESTQDANKAREEAVKMFNSRNKAIEAPNGEEVTLPFEYMGYESKDFVKVALADYNFRDKLKKSISLFGMNTDFKSRLSIRKSVDYARNKNMIITYDGNPVSVFTPKSFEQALNSVNTELVEKAKQRKKKRIEEYKNQK